MKGRVFSWNVKNCVFDAIIIEFAITKFKSLHFRVKSYIIIPIIKMSIFTFCLLKVTSKFLVFKLMFQCITCFNTPLLPT